MQPEQLRKVCSTLSPESAITIAGLIDGTLKIFGVQSLGLLQMFVAQTAHESAEYRIREENLNYSSVDRLRKIWPSHFKDVEQAEKCIHHPQALGEYIYGTGTIAKSLGNNVPRDGWEFRGSGFLQLTGREAFTQYFEWLKSNDLAIMGDEELYAMAKQVRESEIEAMRTAGWEFFVNKKLTQLTGDHAKDLEHFTRRINGGLIGLDSRKRYYDNALEYITEL